MRSINASARFVRSSALIALPRVALIPAAERRRRSAAEGEGAAHGADHEPVSEVTVEAHHCLEAGAMLGDDVIELERPEGIDHAADPLLAEATQVKAADHRVDLGDARDVGRPAADADDAAMGARGDDDEAPVAHVGDQGLLADERVLFELAIPLDAE